MYHTFSGGGGYIFACGQLSELYRHLEESPGEVMLDLKTGYCQIFSDHGVVVPHDWFGFPPVAYSECSTVLIFGPMFGTAGSSAFI